MSYYTKVIKIQGTIPGDADMDTLIELSDIASDFEIKTVNTDNPSKYIAWWFEIPTEYQEKINEILNSNNDD